MDETTQCHRTLIRIARAENGADTEPALAETLAAAAHDPELAALRAEEAAFDRHLATQLKVGLRVPSDLRARLLALESQLSGPESPGAEPIPFPAPANTGASRRRWSLPLIGLAAAAVVAVGLVLRETPLTGPASPFPGPVQVASVDPLSSLVQAVSQRSQTLPDYEFRAARLEDVREFLNAQRTVSMPWKIPEALRGLPTEGCVTFEVMDSSITMVSFTGERPMRLFIVGRQNFPGCAERYRPAIEEVAGQPVAAWTCSRALYFVTTENPTDDAFADLF